MSGLNTSLSVALQTLQQQAAGLEVTNNNIANANTAGYSRQVVVTSESAPVEAGNVLLGAGATLEGVESVRDQLLTLRIQQQTQQQASADAQASGLSAIQPAFASSSSDLGSNLSAFFSSVSALSAAPHNISTRQAVLSASQGVVDAFNTASFSLTEEQTALNGQVTADVAQINDLSSQIAGLNAQIAQQPAGTNAVDTNGALADQENQLVLQLSKLTNVSVIQTDHGESITTANGTPLVLGSTSYPLQTSIGSGGATQVLDSNGNNITASISGGDLGGTIRLRDTTIPGLLNQLDDLASEFANSVNAAQAQGYDENGATGKPLFSVPASVAGAAAHIAVATVDPAAIAASSDTSSGGNGNVANLSAVGTTALPSGATPSDAYANLVYSIGSAASSASAESKAVQQSLAQLTSQQGAVSGVSIDEESANLIRYQQGYEAAARVISTLENLFSVTINLAGGGA